MPTSSLHRYLETLDHVKIVEKTKQGVGIGEKATSYMIHWLGSQA